MLTDDILVSQYRSALKMLRAAVAACPAPAWNDPSSENRFWQVAYHAVFYAHLYLSRSETAFQPWEKSIPEYNFLGRLPWPPHDPPKIGRPYEPPEILEYCDLVIARVRDLVREAPQSGGSGFHWLPMGRRELHLYNLRHIQHHAGQLIERLRARGISGQEWLGMKPDGGAAAEAAAEAATAATVDAATEAGADTGRAEEDSASTALSPTRAGIVSLREITAESVREICDLSTRESQRSFVAPNAVSLAQALFSDRAWFRGVFAGETAVGFVMLHEDSEKPEYYLWRFMIDGRYQRMGFGRRAMELVIERVRSLPGARELLTSVVPGEGSPQEFYERLGFHPTGDWDDGEAVLRLELKPPRA